MREEEGERIFVYRKKKVSADPEANAVAPPDGVAVSRKLRGTCASSLAMPASQQADAMREEEGEGIHVVVHGGFASELRRAARRSRRVQEASRDLCLLNCPARRPARRRQE